MTEIMEYVCEKLDWAAGRILELLTGLRGYRMLEVLVRVPNIPQVVGTGQAQRFPSSGSGTLCDRY